MKLTNELNIMNHKYGQVESKSMEWGVWTITTLQDVTADRECYSKGWHNKFGPKYSVENRQIELKRKYGRGYQRLCVDLNSWAGDYVVKAVNELNLGPKKSKIKLKVRLNKAFDAKLTKELRGYKFYQRTLLGEIYDYVIESPEGVLYHDDNYNNLITVLRIKVSQMRSKLPKFSSRTLINLKLCKQLGFCNAGVAEFCSQFNLDLSSSYYFYEIITKVQQNKKEALPFISELNMLSTSVGGNHQF